MWVLWSKLPFHPHPLRMSEELLCNGLGAAFLLGQKKGAAVAGAASDPPNLASEAGLFPCVPWTCPGLQEQWKPLEAVLAIQAFASARIQVPHVGPPSVIAAVAPSGARVSQSAGEGPLPRPGSLESPAGFVPLRRAPPPAACSGGRRGLVKHLPRLRGGAGSRPAAQARNAVAQPSAPCQPGGRGQVLFPFPAEAQLSGRREPCPARQPGSGPRREEAAGDAAVTLVPGLTYDCRSKANAGQDPCAPSPRGFTPLPPCRYGGVRPRPLPAEKS